MEIANTVRDEEYTRMVMDIVAGKPFGSWKDEGAVSVVEPEVQVLPDELPEETELNNTQFVDNKSS